MDIQCALWFLRCHAGEELRPDGDPGDKTSEALAEFQSHLGLEITGELDRNTLAEMMEQVPMLFAEIPPEGVGAFLDQLFPMVPVPDAVDDKAPPAANDDGVKEDPPVLLASGEAAVPVPKDALADEDNTDGATVDPNTAGGEDPLTCDGQVGQVVHFREASREEADRDPDLQDPSEEDDEA